MPEGISPTHFVDAGGSASMELVFDAWTPMSFKRSMGNKRTGGLHFVAPSWVGPHARRLMAYRILQSYVDNSARVFLGTKSEEDQEQHREYGDGSLIVNQIVAALLGEEQSIVTEGAADYEEPEPEDERREKVRELQREKATRPPPPVIEPGEPDPATGEPPPPEIPDPDPVSVAQSEVERGDFEEQDELDKQIADLQKPQNDPEVEKAFELQEWLKKWAKQERLILKMLETERNAVGLGDGVYVLGWNGSKGRARCRVFDPGFYFPVLSDDHEDDFPEKVHIAWEIPQESHTDGDHRTKIRRITWELGPIEGARTPGPIQQAFGVEVTPLDGDTLEADGRLSRTYDWNDEPSYVTCYMTDAVFELDVQNRTIDDLYGEGTRVKYLEDADGEINRRDLQIDFIPVVHVPNTVAIQNHYGRSTLATILQILDDLANADTDLQAASATTGQPVLVLHGATFNGEKMTYRAGEVIETGDGGMDVLDTSRALDALLKYIEALLKRLSVNARLPESVLGRVDPSRVPSGVALALSFGPLASMVGEMRLVREEKYALLLKFAWRLAVAGQAKDVPSEWVESNVQFGSYLPQDEQSAVESVTKLMAAGAVSLETAVRMLMSAGLPIEDAANEVERIQSRDFEGADALLTATGDEDAVFEYLGMERPPGAPPIKPPQPVIVPPGGVGAVDPANPNAAVKGVTPPGLAATASATAAATRGRPAQP